MEFTRLAKRLMVILLACSCFQPLTTVAQVIDFAGAEFHEPVDVEYWKQHPRNGVDVTPFLRKGKVMFRHPISFRGARFYSMSDFNYAQFNSATEFNNVQFNFAAGFYRAQFNSKIDYRLAHFHSSVDFESAVFNSTVDYNYAHFDSSANFKFADFQSTADFSGARFFSSAEFFNAQIHSTADFSNAGFASWAEFLNVQFHSTADFADAVFLSDAYFEFVDFHSTVDFEFANFHTMANFRGARFKDKVSFNNSTLPDSLDFREVINIANEIDFTYSNPPSENEKCHIALAGTDIDKIKINMRLFELWFPADTTFIVSLAASDTIRLIDRIDSSSYDEKTSVYESVLKKLQDDGFMDSYRILDINYREFKYRHEGGLNWYVANTFHRLWWNYAYSKELIFLWTLGFLLLFSTLNINFYRRLSEDVYAIPFLGEWDNDSMRWPKSWIYYWLQVVTYTSIIFFGLKMDISKFKQGVIRSHPFLFAYLMFIYVLGLVCMGFIVNIIFTR
ncbi:MAG: hypothetical protein V3W18_06430 [candidate division Zixibacteria bacterium]